MICEKIAYDTYKEAIKALKGISAKAKRSFNIYKCQECKKFHLTSIKFWKTKVKSEKIKPTADRFLLSPGHKLDQAILKAQLEKVPPHRSIDQPLATFKLGELMNWPTQIK